MLECMGNAITFMDMDIIIQVIYISLINLLYKVFKKNV